MTILAFIIVLGILVLVHEWGHFQVARWCGVRVETFSIGFGPQLAAIERGDTTYRIAAIPLGGYVKMYGDEPGEEGSDDPEGYYAQPIAQRAAIVLAGPVMNILFAFAIAPLMYMIGVPEPAYLAKAPVIGWVDSSAASTVPLQSGDQVLTANGEPIDTWRQLQNTMAITQGELQLSVQRNSNTLDLTLQSEQAGDLLGTVLPPMDTRIERVLPDTPAERARLQTGDRIVAINEQPIQHWMGIRAALAATTATAPVIAVEIERDGMPQAVTMQLSENEDGRLLMGVARQDATNVKRYGPLQSVKLGTARVVEMFGLTFEVLARLFTGRLGLDALGGPVMIAQGAGDAAAKGIGALLTFMVFISIQLGVLNLLPIPVLDGGHLVLMGAEAALGRRLPDKAIAIAQYAGFAALMLLILYVTRNDIMRIWGTHIRQWLDAW